MSEKIEQVARAIWDVRAANTQIPWEQRSHEFRDGVRAEVRAAIEAMRVPSEGMFEQMQEEINLSDRPGQFEFLSRDEITAIWQCGIDEALR